jgi:hypothetical protein
MNFLRGAVSGATGATSGDSTQPAKLNNFPICCPFLYHNIVGECGNKIYLAIMNVVAYFGTRSSNIITHIYQFL